MPYQIGSACYPTLLAAAQAAASSQAGAIVQHGGSSFVVELAAVSETAITYNLHPVGGGAAIVQQSPFLAAPCNLLTAEDGLQMGWLVAGVWIAVYAVRFIASAVRGETGGNYGSNDA